jgi:hypothetical protein
MGQAMVALGLLSTVPLWRIPGLVSLGRRSLGVYVAHLVVLYGGRGTPGWSAAGRTSCRCSTRSGWPRGAWRGGGDGPGRPGALRWLEENAAPRWQQPSGEPG